MCVCVCVQSCPTLCDPMDFTLPGFSVHGILQARIMKWVAIPFSRGSSLPRNQTEFPALQADSMASLVAQIHTHTHTHTHIIYTYK